MTGICKHVGDAAEATRATSPWCLGDAADLQPLRRPGLGVLSARVVRVQARSSHSHRKRRMYPLVGKFWLGAVRQGRRARRGASAKVRKPSMA